MAVRLPVHILQGRRCAACQKPSPDGEGGLQAKLSKTDEVLTAGALRLGNRGTVFFGGLRSLFSEASRSAPRAEPLASIHDSAGRRARGEQRGMGHFWRSAPPPQAVPLSGVCRPVLAKKSTGLFSRRPNPLRWGRLWACMRALPAWSFYMYANFPALNQWAGKLSLECAAVNGVERPALTRQ